MDFPSTATFYSDHGTFEAHRLRFLAAEKNPYLTFRESHELPQQFAALVNEEHFPLLIDKSILVYGSNALDAYLLEKYLGEDLLPPDPNTRAKVRMLADEITSNWYTPNTTEHHHARLQELAQNLPERTRYFAGPKLTLIDIALAPLLWMYRHYIHNELPGHVAEYALRLFDRIAFRKSLPPSQLCPAMVGHS